jgi:hypothetical protein
VTVGPEAKVPIANPTDHLISGAWVGDWVLDPNRSAVRFRSTSAWGLVKVTGRFIYTASGITPTSPVGFG